MLIISYRSKDSGMTLVEVLVAMVILGLVLVAVYPLITQSLHVTNLSNTIATQLFGDQENIEIVAATNGGVYFADGTFLPNKYFPVVFGSNVTPVPGMTVKKSKLIRFLGSIPHLSGCAVYEGYTKEEAVITISGNDTNFIDTTSTKLKVTDKNGSDVTSLCSNYTVSSKTVAKVTIPTNSSRFTNFNSPYFIYLTTGNEKISALLQVHLPRAVIVKENHDLLIASSPIPTNWVDSSGSSNWVEKTTHNEIQHDINKVIFIQDDEQESSFLAIGDEGSIYRWEYGKKWRQLDIDAALKDENEDANLNNILVGNDGYFVVGDEGVILSSADGLTWKQLDSNTSANLRAITYFQDKNQYVCVGDRGVILTSSNGKDWTHFYTYPKLVNNGLNGHNAVMFNGEGDYLKTALAPVTGGNSRTVFMLIKPDSTANTLLSWGSPLDTKAGGRFDLRIEGQKLVMEKDTGTVFTSGIDLPSTAALVICRSDSNSFGSYRLSKNGDAYEQSTINGLIDTDSLFPAQLGSDPLTRYTGPLPYKGLIAEVLIFDSAVSYLRDPLDPPDPNIEFASDLDLIQKYFSDKYNLGIDELNGTELEDLYYPGTETSLEENCDDFTSYVSHDAMNHLVLWLDATNPDSLDIGANDQVELWNDLSNVKNHACGAALNAVACNDKGQLIAGGEHRNLILYENDIVQDKFLQGNTDPVVQYSLDEMLFAQNRFVTLLNNNLGSSNSYIATFNRKGISANDRKISNYYLNDLFYYSDSKVLLVAGNHGTILYSENNGANWDTSDGDTTDDLLAACLR